jgi:hypothetical protein
VRLPRDAIAIIASRYATEPDVIRELNDLGPSDLPVLDGDLRVPAPARRISKSR